MACKNCGKATNRRSSRNSLCPECWKEANPDAVDGTEIMKLRERLGLTVAECAAAINMDCKEWVDEVEDSLQLHGEYARAIRAAIETLAEERRDMSAQPEQTPAPAGSLAVDAL